MKDCIYTILNEETNIFVRGIFVATVINENQLPVQEGVQIIVPYETDKEYFIDPPTKISGGIFYKIVKRAFDLIVSFCALCVLWLPMLILGIIVKATSDGPALYKQERLGKNGKPFNIVKFRTMIKDSEVNGAQWSEGENDPRITPVGRFLRNTRLDELPQLWCIFTGKMSFVGPRPERDCFYEEFEKYIHGFKHRLCVTPGLTGLAQVNGGYNLKPEEKIIYDMEYINNRSIVNDIKIMFRTVAVIFTHDGAK